MPCPNDNLSQPPQSGDSRTILWLMLIALGSAGGVLCVLNDRLGALTMIPLALGACLGFRSGAWKMFSMLTGSVCGLYFAAPTSIHLIPWLEDTFNRPISNPTLGLALSGFVAGSIASVLAMGIGWFLMHRIQGLRSFDRHLGMIVGTAKSLALVSIGLWTVLALEPRMIRMRSAAPRLDEAGDASLDNRLLHLADATRNSPCLTCLTSWNPIAQHPLFHRTLDSLESTVLELQSQSMTAQSRGLPSASKLTGMFHDLHRQGSIDLPGRPQAQDSPSPSISLDNLGSLLQRLVDDHGH